MVFDKLKKIICEEFEIDETDIELDISLFDLGFDELDVTDLCMSIEDCFDIEVTQEAAEDFKNIGDIVRYIEENK